MGIKFGISGIPIHAADWEEGIEFLKQNKLCIEMPFTRKVYLREGIAEIIKESCLAVSAHAPYYINLCSARKIVRERSKQLIVKAAMLGAKCGAKKLVLHLGYYANSFEQSRAVLVENVLEVKERLKELNVKVMLSPENAGKIKALGSVEEILEICRILKLEPTIDFAHFYARNLGRINEKEGFIEMLESVKSRNRKWLKNLHMHISGIVFGKRGERYHCSLNDSCLNWKGCLEALKELKVKGELICESPLQEEDALMMRRYFENL